MASTPLGSVLVTAVSTGAGFALGHGVSPVIRPLIQEEANRVWTLHPAVPLTAQEAAEAVVRDLMTVDEAHAEAARTGINADRFDVLHGLAGNPPAPEELLALWNRGTIDKATVERGLRQSRLRPEWFDEYEQLRHNLLSAPQLAEMVVQSIIDRDTAAELAGRVGVDGDQFDRLVRVSGNPPGPMELLDLWNRGRISEADVDRGLAQSRLKPEWVDQFKELRHVLPSVSDLVRFAVREVYTPGTRAKFGLDEDFPAEFSREAAKRGLSDETARQYWAAHWNLPSPQQAYRMLWRGLIDEQELDLLLKTADYTPFWRDKLAAIAHIVPGRIDLRRMFKAGIITRPEVKAGYKRLGYTDADAETLTRFAEAEKAGGSTGKTLTLTQLRAEYEAGFMPEQAFRSTLATLGYDAAETDALVHLGDYARVKRTRDAIVNNAHKGFVARGMDETRARELLTQAGMHADAQTAEIAGWTLERESLTAELTDAQIVKAYKKGLMTEADAIEELVSRGLVEDDARIRLQL